MNSAQMNERAVQTVLLIGAELFKQLISALRTELSKTILQNKFFYPEVIFAKTEQNFLLGKIPKNRTNFFIQR